VVCRGWLNVAVVGWGVGPGPGPEAATERSEVIVDMLRRGVEGLVGRREG
jgi:hypothetical protein